MNGGAFNINGTVTSTNVQLAGATLTGNSVIRGGLNWIVGDWNNSASETIAANSTLLITSGNDHNMANCTVTNNGTVGWSGGSIRGGGGSGGTFIYNSGVWDAQSDQTFNDVFDGNGTVFNNSGTFRKSGSTGGNTTFTGGVTFNQLSGAVDVQKGNLVLQGGGSFTGGFTATNNTSVTYLSSGSFNFNGALTSSNVIDNAGNLVGTNIIRGALTWQAGNWNSAPQVTLATNSTLYVNNAVNHDMANCTLINNGTVEWSDGTIRGGGGSGGTFIYNNGVWDTRSDQTFNNDFTGNGTVFNNSGTFRKSADTGATTMSVPFTNTGTVDAQTGTINFNGGYTQTGGTLSFSIRSLTDFGRINISGNAPLTGTLNIVRPNGYQPSLSNTFQVMTYNSHSGAFAAVTGCSIGNGLFFDALYQNTQLLLVVKDGAPHFDSLHRGLINGQFEFRLTTGTAGQTYVIEASTTLTNWIPISTNTLPNCVLDFVDTNAVSFPHRFYRAVLVP